MANRIISFQQDPIQKRLQDNPYEVFLDVDMRSRSAFSTGYEYNDITPPLSAYYDLLVAEGKLSAIAKDGTYLSIEGIKLDNVDDILKEYGLVAENHTDEEYTQIITENINDPVFFALLSSTEYKKQQYELIPYKYQNYNIGRLVNVNAIRNSLHNIFTWIPGERVLLPEFGSNLRKLLYEGITDYNIEQVIAEIRAIVTKWEPRVRIESIVDVSTIDDHENNTIHLKVIYVIPGLSDAQFEYDYVLPILAV